MNSRRSLQIKTPVIVLVGPTAIGKTKLSLAIASRFDCEIISMDSMQVYRHMDIGTAKPTAQEQQHIRHHLIDIVTPDEQYSAARFIGDCLQAIKEITRQGKIPLITGGTGLYFSALINGLFDNIHVKDEVRIRLNNELEAKGLPCLYKKLCRIDPVSAARIHKNDRHRIVRGLEIFASTGIPWSTHIEHQKRKKPLVRFDQLLAIGLRCERDLLYERIKQRSKAMFRQGLVDEVKGLRAKGYEPSLPPMQAIGYRHVNQCLNGKWTEAVMKEYLVRDTRRYAKRQMTWFRRHDTLRWYERTATKAVIQDINSKISSN